MTNELAYVKHPARIIARLDVKGSNVVKGIQMEGLRIVGEPNALARKYYEQGADELIFMDIVASLYGRNQILPVIENAAQASSWAMAGVPATPIPMDITAAAAKALARPHRDNPDMGFNM